METPPAYNSYPDQGCPVSPTCLNCPLSVCKEDDPKHYRNVRHLIQHYQRYRAGPTMPDDRSYYRSKRRWLLATNAEQADVLSLLKSRADGRPTAQLPHL